MTTTQIKTLPCGYEPLPVQADTDKLANQGERLLIYFPRRWEPGNPIETRIAAQGMLTAGWVIGIRYMEPLYHQCRDCGGRGFTTGDGFSDDTNDCGSCGGSGQVPAEPAY